jgi:hypothetical protein
VEIGIVMRRHIGSALIVGALLLPGAAQADTPNYVAPSGEQTIHAMITSINGKYGLTVRDGRVGLASVTMHRGTIIDPIGLQLKPGMQITIAGHADGGTFDANEIDAPVEYLEAQNRARSADATIAPWTPLYVPNGMYQGHGPSAEGGG